MTSRPLIRSKLSTNFKGDEVWSFGIVNGKLAEIFFIRDGDKVKFTGYAYTKKSEYKTKTELKWIEEETKRVRLSYKNGKYSWLKK